MDNTWIAYSFANFHLHRASGTVYTALDIATGQEVSAHIQSWFLLSFHSYWLHFFFDGSYAWQHEWHWVDIGNLFHWCPNYPKWMIYSWLTKEKGMGLQHWERAYKIKNVHALPCVPKEKKKQKKIPWMCVFNDCDSFLHFNHPSGGHKADEPSTAAQKGINY